MFKLFINNLQVGNYRTYRAMITDLVTIYCTRKQCTSMVHKGKTLAVVLI